MNTAYVYKWTHLPTLRWYIGSRTAKNSHINDGYICSSKIVKPLILKNPMEWERTIVSIGTVQEIRDLETKILELFDAKNDAFSFNKHNQNGKFICSGHTETTKEKIKINHKWSGKKRPEQSKALMGRKRDRSIVEKWASKLRGKKFTQDHVDALKKAMRKYIYITPCGTFHSSREAAKANDISKAGLLNLCKGYVARNVFYPSKDGWEMRLKHENF